MVSNSVYEAKVILYKELQTIVKHRVIRLYKTCIEWSEYFIIEDSV